jgi:hypothetical protein
MGGRDRGGDGSRPKLRLIVGGQLGTQPVRLINRRSAAAPLRNEINLKAEPLVLLGGVPFAFWLSLLVQSLATVNGGCGGFLHQASGKCCEDEF